MIIFGSKSYLHQLAMLTLVCAQCGNPAAHALRKRVAKFTLFFVPLFPYSTTYATQCTFCGLEQRLNREQAEQLRIHGAGGGAAGSPATPRPGAWHPGPR
ncbi:zinc-ribbon domain-containing protein [Streptomyces sp. HNM0663]|uniref:Zinc-ribbon domain-containing protein n=1 Tax=Streptomyces chengmaiensis TaxID=3040919 RepID=A0ABT6HGI6_9ACTN|nr:zinc-ribbon domain-containing protein [Streptomyces chengmaiensis]MDH2387451.1 zinc-ribbon domain-containing protein [Streptomyces chengmaiensis]